jgi:flagellar basal body rod protein FlgC
MERRLGERSLQDEDFRQRLLSDPKGAIEEELETRLPQEVQVQAVEESAETIYLVLPPAPSRANEQGEVELSDRELEGVAGAGTWGDCTLPAHACTVY